MHIYQFHHYIKPEFVEAYKDAIVENARETFKESGIIRFDVLQDKEDPTHFSLIEVYRDMAAREAHLETKHFLKWKETVQGQDMFARRGKGNEFEAAFPSGVDWQKSPVFLLDEKNAEVTPESVVTLQEVTDKTARKIMGLKVKAGQENFVAPNAVSIAQAHFEPKAWFRGIYADETPIGFAMLFDDPEKPMYYLWRYMIDGRYQGMGFGEKAMTLVVDYVKTRPNATEMFLSYVPSAGSPRDFYAKCGFVDTGKEHSGELEMRLDLTLA